MKKLFSKIAQFFGAVSVLFIISAARAFALDTTTTLQWIQGSPSKIATDSSVLATVTFVLNWILGITATVAVGFIIVGGFQYITSAGNEGLAEQGKETITKAIMGLVFILLAFVIMSTINGILTGCFNGVPVGGAATCR